MKNSKIELNSLFNSTWRPTEFCLWRVARHTWGETHVMARHVTRLFTNTTGRSSPHCLHQCSRRLWRTRQARNSAALRN